MPPRWRELLEPKGLHSGRNLADALDISPQTAQRLIHGESVDDGTIESAAELLGVEPNDIRKLRREQPRRAFRLPADAANLTEKQRQAVLSVVRAMLEPAGEVPATVTRIRAARRRATPRGTDEINE